MIKIGIVEDERLLLDDLVNNVDWEAWGIEVSFAERRKGPRAPAEGIRRYRAHGYQHACNERDQDVRRDPEALSGCAVYFSYQL